MSEQLSLSSKLQISLSLNSFICDSELSSTIETIVELESEITS